MRVEFLIFSLWWIFCQSNEIPSKYILVDDIKVLREDYEAFVNSEKELKRKKTTNEDWFEKEIQLEESETPEYSKRFPKRCHGKSVFFYIDVNMLCKVVSNILVNNIY